MRFLAYLHSLAARFFHRSQIEDDMEEELRTHIGHRADDLERSGLVSSETGPIRLDATETSSSISTAKLSVRWHAYHAANTAHGHARTT